MKQLFSRAIAVAMACALASPSTALAGGPAVGPSYTSVETFEVGISPTYSALPWEPGFTAAWWGPRAAMGRAGTRGLWAAGTNGTGSLYPERTEGQAVFALPTADLYSADARFYYTYPSRGAADSAAFKADWEPEDYLPGDGGSFLPRYFPLTAQGVWSSAQAELSAGPSNLSRHMGTLRFDFFDSYGNVGEVPATGAGPVIDDFTVSGYHFGSVRQLNGVVSGSDVSLTWQRPLRSKMDGETATEERAVAYRIWRRPIDSASAWTEIAPSPVTSAGDTVGTLDVNAAQAGGVYVYAVQVVGAADASMYGRSAERAVSTALTPFVRITSPTSGFTPKTLQVTGVASPGGAGGAIGAVRLVIRRGSPARYWSGTAWSSSPATITATSTDSWGTWGTSSIPMGTYDGVTVTATAVNAAQTSSAPSVVTSIDPVDPTTLRSTSSATIVAYGSAASISGTLSRVDGVPVAGVHVRLERLVNGSWSAYRKLLTNAAGSVSFAENPTVKTTYRLAFLADAARGGSVSPSTHAVTPKVYLAAPYAPVAATRNIAFSSAGYLKPYHSVGGYPVKILAQKKVGGVWVNQFAVWARASAYGTHTKYSAKVVVSSAGTWRLQAWAPADARHASTYSAPGREFTVR